MRVRAEQLLVAFLSGAMAIAIVGSLVLAFSRVWS